MGQRNWLWILTLGWQIVFAKISTDGLVVRDSFYVTRDLRGPPDPAARAALEGALRIMLQGEGP